MTITLTQIIVYWSIAFTAIFGASVIFGAKRILNRLFPDIDNFKSYRQLWEENNYEDIN